MLWHIVSLPLEIVLAFPVQAVHWVSHLLGKVCMRDGLIPSSSLTDLVSSRVEALVSRTKHAKILWVVNAHSLITIHLVARIVVLVCMKVCKRARDLVNLWFRTICHLDAFSVFRIEHIIHSVAVVEAYLAIISLLCWWVFSVSALICHFWITMIALLVYFLDYIVRQADGGFVLILYAHITIAERLMRIGSSMKQAGCLAKFPLTIVWIYNRNIMHSWLRTLHHTSHRLLKCIVGAGVWISSFLLVSMLLIEILPTMEYRIILFHSY